MKKQTGFLEILPFFPEVKTENVRIVCLSSERGHFERYVRKWLPKVEEIIKAYLTTRSVISSTCSKIHCASILKELLRPRANLSLARTSKARG
jgi:hypothetical protein